MEHVSEYESVDKTALKSALLALHLCPNCRSDLLSVALLDEVYGCKQYKETWYLPKEVTDMTLSSKDRAAITFDHLLTFIAQCDLGDSRMDTLKLRDLLTSAISNPTEAADTIKFLIAALEYVHASGKVTL